MSIVADALLGLDVGWTNVRAVLERTAGRVASGPVLRRVADDYPPFHATIAGLTDDLTITRGDVSAIGVGVPGVVAALLLAGQPVEESG